MRTLFEDRHDAGRRLARELARRRADAPAREGRAGDRVGSAPAPPLVLALPRGGVPVALEVARELRAPLDLLVVRKLGLPGHPELAIGAVASGGAQVLNEELVRALHVPERDIERVRAAELRELARRERSYRGARPPLELRGREIIVVDDGIATGATMRVAVRALQEAGARRVVVATPVAAREACAQLAAEADAVVCLATPEPFTSVGQWYRTFEQTSDAEVVEALLVAERFGR